MPANKEPIIAVEFDIDYCNLSFGLSPCLAVMHGANPRKCFNTWKTCSYKSAYSKGVKTYRFVQGRSNLPVGGDYLPLVKSVSVTSSTVNIAGSDADMNGIGVRATYKVTFLDTADSDRLTDKYQAQRISGDAQINEGGYDPRSRGTFWSKFKARNPNYAGRPMRIKYGHIQNGAYVWDKVIHGILTESSGPDSNNVITFTAKDILALADNEKAVAPKASNGTLFAAITATDTTLTLNPAGVGAEYATSGWVVVGSEIMGFTRSGDVMTITRGQRGTAAASHAVNVTVQQTYSPRLERLDYVVYDILVNYASVPAAYIDFAEWNAEFTRWAPNLKLTADICKATGIKTLLAELAILGVSIWWDDVNQKIRLKVNRPPDTDIVRPINDDANIIELKSEDNDSKRLTRLYFYTVQSDPTKELSETNFLRGYAPIDIDSEHPNGFNGVQSKEIRSRWLNHGDNSLVRTLSIRFLKRFEESPVTYDITLDYKDDVGLTDVIDMNTRVVSDVTGLPETTQMQIIKREDADIGSTIKVKAQKFFYTSRYAYFTENSRPSYNESSQAQKNRGAYFSNGFFSDNTKAYVFS